MLLAIPALRALRADGLSITLAAQPRIGALLVALGIVDQAIAFDTLGLDALFADAPVERDARVARHLGAASRVVCWFGAREAGFVHRVRELAPDAVVAPPASTDTSVWRHLLATVSERSARESPRLPIDTTRLCAPVAVSAALREQARHALRNAGWDGGSRLVLLHPGAGGVAKRWPVDGFVDAVADVHATIVVHEGPADADAARAVLARMRGSAVALVDPPLPVLAGALAESIAYLGNDSGVSHLAAVVGTPCVVLFTPAALPWVPWSGAARCLTVSTASVVPHERAEVHAALMALT